MSAEEAAVQTGPEQAGSAPATGNPARPIPYERFLDCVHCGLCTAACPTYLELGDENEGPRGRIYLMRAVADGRLELDDRVVRHLDHCLDCRACESACPSGVQYGRLIEPFRVGLRDELGKSPAIGRLERLVIGRLLSSRPALRVSLGAARLAQVTGLDWLMNKTGLSALLPRTLRRMREQLPRFRYFVPRLPRRLKPVGERRARVVLFTGCVADVVFRQTHWATARVLQQNGCEVHVPRGQKCCGALAYHAGLLRPALPLILANIRALRDVEADAIVVNVAGCGSMLKDYRHVLEEALAIADPGARGEIEQCLEWADQVVSRVRDVTEFLCELEPVPPRGRMDLRAVYHDACHLAHAQRIRSEPRRLLRMVPGLELVDLPESEVCCGAAGTYALTEPELSDRLARRKADNIVATGVHAIFTPNAGCLIQIQKALRDRDYAAWIAHPVEVLDRSYRELPPPLPT